ENRETPMKRKGQSILRVELLEHRLALTAYTWAYGGPGAGDWGTAANWSPVGVPGTGDSATFPDGTPSCTVAGGVTVGSLNTGFGYTGTISMTGGNAFVIESGGNLHLCQSPPLAVLPE